MSSSKIEIKKYGGRLLHITKTGFITNVYEWDSKSRASYMYYDATTKQYDLIFKGSKNGNDGFKYFIATLDQENKKITFHIILDLWLQDLQKQNSKFSVEKYYNMKETVLNQDLNKKFVTVHFKDSNQEISSEKLKELKSDFVNEQLLQTEIYLEAFTYEEYQNQTQEFLEYVNSYKLHIYLKEKMYNDLLSMVNIYVKN